jgi:DNA-binding CsgD family transcriptional regulator
MSKASEELLERAVKLCWKHGCTEEDIKSLFGISKAKVKALRKVA